MIRIYLMTLLEIIRTLNTDSKCLDFIAKVRWPTQITCPRCGGEKISRLRIRNKLECSKCKYQYNATAGTAFSKTYIPLPKWMLALYLYCSSKGKVKSAELARTLDLPYKTAWNLRNRIRKNHSNFDFDRLAGLV